MKDGGTWASADERWPLDDSQILKAIACAPRRFFVGTRSGKMTRYAVLDIDKNSRYHSKSELDKLLKALSDAGLSRSSLYRSSFSGGWHLYIFFEENINSTELRRNLVRLLSLNGFEIAKGKLEIFPHPGTASLGMGLRLPLQEGFAWLDKETLDVEYERETLSPGKALEFFLDVLDSDANSLADYRLMMAHVEKLDSLSNSATDGASEEVNNVVPIRRVQKISENSEYAVYVARIFNGCPLNINAEDWSKGRLFHIQGLSGPSQRAEAIFCLSHYLFYGDPSRDLPALGYGYETERELAIREFMEARHNGHSTDISRGRSDALAQVERAANWLPPERRGADPKKYVSKQPINWVRANAKKLNEARTKIQRAFEDLRSLGRSFTTVELEEHARVSRRTLYKHDDIWRKDYEDLAVDFFASCVHEYNAVEEPTCLEEKASVLSCDRPSVLPPGLLAARRIISDFSLQTKSEERKAAETVERSVEDLAERWRSKVAELTKEAAADIPDKRLRTLIVILSDQLAFSPCEEDETTLRPYLRELKREFSIRQKGPNRKNPDST